MFACMPLARTFRPLVAIALFGAGTAVPTGARAQVAAETVGPVAGQLAPDGTPEQLFAFIDRLRNPEDKPNTREEMLAYFEYASNASIQAAERILAQVQPGDPAHARAALIKLETLRKLGDMGSERAAADMVTYAASLVASPDKALAREAQRCLVVADMSKATEDEDFTGVPGIVARAAELLAADPDDPQTAGLCLQIAMALEQASGGEEHAAAAYRTFAPLFAKSGDRRTREVAESIDGTLLRLSLPGKPLKITGNLLDGTAFDPQSVAGKVVLVDFWATWCGPCLEEIPNILAAYEKYHAKGFEVVGVSVDDEREAVAALLQAKPLPWPILFGDGFNGPMAKRYGIIGIPQLILVGRDGNVICLNAKGDVLHERLAELFPDAR